MHFLRAGTFVKAGSPPVDFPVLRPFSLVRLSEICNVASWGALSPGAPANAEAAFRGACCFGRPGRLFSLRREWGWRWPSYFFGRGGGRPKWLFVFSVGGGGRPKWLRFVNSGPGHVVLRTRSVSAGLVTHEPPQTIKPPSSH